MRAELEGIAGVECGGEKVTFRVVMVVRDETWWLFCAESLGQRYHAFLLLATCPWTFRPTDYASVHGLVLQILAVVEFEALPAHVMPLDAVPVFAPFPRAFLAFHFENSALFLHPNIFLANLRRYRPRHGVHAGQAIKHLGRMEASIPGT